MVSPSVPPADNPAVTPAPTGATGGDTGVFALRRREVLEAAAPVAPTTTFNLADLNSMVELCYGTYTVPDRDTWITQLDDLLGIRLGAVRLSDIEVLDTATILALLDSQTHSKYVTPVRTMRLKTILDYVTLVSPSLDPSMTFDSVLSLAKAAVARKTPSPVVTPVVTPTKPAGPDFDGALSKKVDLPKLTNFKGDTGEWYTWSEGVRIQLGSAGVSGAITDSNFAQAHPVMTKRVFFVLYAAILQGNAGSLAKEMEINANFDAYALWQRLTKDYDTEANKLNVSLYLVQRLMDIKLTKSVPVLQFRNKFRDTWLEYKQVNPRMAVEPDFIRPLMLMAVQDDDYDLIRESIIADPSLTIPQFLNDLRDRDTILKGVNGENMRNIDGQASSTVRGRRAPTHNAGGGKSHYAKKNNDHHSSHRGTSDRDLSGPWNVPYIPRTWKQMLGGGVFSTLNKWRTTAHGSSIAMSELNKQFEVDKQQYPSSSKKRRNSAVQDSTTTTRTRTDDGQTDDAGTSVKKVKFVLRDSRRTVTERDATPSSSSS